MDHENKNEESNDGFTDTEKWAQEVLERARNRSEASFDPEDFPNEGNSESQIKDADSDEGNQIQSQMEESFRGSIVTLEDIEGEQTVASMPVDVDQKSINSNDDFFPSTLKGTRRSIV